jgi:hypothetical protein
LAQQNAAVNKIADHFREDDLLYPPPISPKVRRDENEQKRGDDASNGACSTTHFKRLNFICNFDAIDLHVFLYVHAIVIAGNNLHNAPVDVINFIIAKIAGVTLRIQTSITSCHGSKAERMPARKQPHTSPLYNGSNTVCHRMRGGAATASALTTETPSQYDGRQQRRHVPCRVTALALARWL